MSINIMQPKKPLQFLLVNKIGRKTWMLLKDGQSTGPREDPEVTKRKIPANQLE